MNFLKYLSVIVALFLAQVAYAAPNDIYQRNVLPIANDQFTLGTTSLYWQNVFTNILCLAGDCRSAWPSGGGGGGGPTTGETWRLFAGGAGTQSYLAPTTTVGINLIASSTLQRITSLFGTTTNATSTNLFTSNLVVGSLSGLLKATSGIVSVATAGTDYIANTLGDWTGTFDGQEGTFYLNRGNHTGTQASSTITGGFDVPSGGTGATTLSGLLKGAGTAPITTATPGVDYLVSAPGAVLSIFTGGTGSQNYISTTSPFGLVINASSSIAGLDTRNATLTSATTSVLKVGTIRDNGGSAGTVGQLLQSNGTVASWISTSTLGFLSSFNGLSGGAQTLATTSNNAGFGFSSAGTVHTLNIPFVASTTDPGILRATDFKLFSEKISSSSLDTSAKLASLITDETGAGSLVFSGSPTFTGTSIFATLLGASSTIPVFNASSTFTNLLTAGNATVTNATTTNLNIVATIQGAGLTSCNGASNALTYNATTDLFGCNTITSGGGSTFGETLRLFTGGTGSTNYLAPTTTLGIVTNASSSFFGIDARLATATEATTTNLFTSNLRVGSLTGVLKGTSGIVSSASNGTDFTLITGTTCSGSDKVSAISASGVVTCSADVSGGGGSSGGWATTTDRNLDLGVVNYSLTDVYIGGSASTTAVFNFDKDLSQLTISTTTASSTGAFYLGSNGVSILADTDGAITFTSLGNTFKEAFTISMDNVSNEIDITSTTSVDRFDFSTIGINSQGSSTLRFLSAIGATTSNSTTTNGYVSNILSIGSTSPSFPLTVTGNVSQWGNYVHMGNSPGVGDCVTCFEFWGNENTVTGVQIGVGNRNAGTAAFSGYFLDNDLADNRNVNYGFIGLNSSAYSDTSYGPAFAVPNMMFMQNRMGPLSFFSSTSTASSYINFFTGSTTALNERMRITSDGLVGIGTTSPSATFAISTTTTSSILPLFAISSSTGIMSNLMSVFNIARSELLPMANIGFASTSIPSSGVTLSMGGNRPAADMRDQFLFNGRINTGEWNAFVCYTPSIVAALTTTDALGACGDFQYQVDSLGALGVTNTKHAYLSNAGTTANSGAGLFLSAGASYSFASNTPMMEFALNASNTNASQIANIGTTSLYAGWTNTNPAGTTFETIPTAGCFITASGTPAGAGATLNYWAVSKTSNANQTAVDTGIGLITTDYTVAFRIEYGAAGCSYFFKTPTSTQWTTIATHAQNFVASTTGMAPGIYLSRGATTGSNASVIINYIKVWLRKTLWL